MESAGCAAEACWEFLSGDARWLPLPAVMQSELERHYRSPDPAASKSLALHLESKRYVMDFSTMRLKNLSTESCSSVRRLGSDASTADFEHGDHHEAQPDGVLRPDRRIESCSRVADVSIDANEILLRTMSRAMNESKEMVLKERMEAAEAHTSVAGPEGPKCNDSASFVERFRQKFGARGHVEVKVLQRFGSFRHAQVRIDGDRISLQGEDIASFVEFPDHSDQLLAKTWSEDLRYFIVSIDGYMTMVELVPEAVSQPRIARELDLIYDCGIIKDLQVAKRRGDFQHDSACLRELIHRTRRFTRSFRTVPLTFEIFQKLQKEHAVPYFENPAVSEKDAELLIEEYIDVCYSTPRDAKLWNFVGLIEAVAFMDFECALHCFEAGIRVAEDDTTEAMLCANWGQVSGEAIMAKCQLMVQSAKKTRNYLDRAKVLDARFVQSDYGLPLLLKPWLLYTEDTLERLQEERLLEEAKSRIASEISEITACRAG
eukprot:TRINITY_DN63770_c0_g1_i1.p1 TRINITY_DN63770_c0_g1~~TRINITY_DN63770_c0_g1_i1.p1  ORF type:complete len:488 (-),score=99.88 TRINITY_DN63770_c0_g1_i1:60-1523(-)